MKTSVALERNRRIFFVGLNTGYASGGVPDRQFLEFYRQRISTALDCAIVGNVVFPSGFPCNETTPTISGLRVWSEVARTIYDGGSIPGVQLTTAWEGYAGQRKFVARDTAGAIRRCRKVVRGMTKAKIGKLFASLDEGTDLALAAGFRHIQLHAAHGYLFSLLVDGRLFPDAGDVLDKIGRWAKRWSSSDVEVSLRFSLRTGDAEFDAKGSTAFHDSVASLPVKYIDVSSGFYNIDKQLIYPARPDVLERRRIETMALANRHQNAEFIYSGRAMRQSSDDLPANVHIGLCRDLIANAQYLAKRSRGCQNSGKCHYYSRGISSLTCALWAK